MKREHEAFVLRSQIPHFVAEDDCEILVILAPPPMCWNYVCTTACSRESLASPWQQLSGLRKGEASVQALWGYVLGPELTTEEFNGLEWLCNRVAFRNLYF